MGGEWRRETKGRQGKAKGKGGQKVRQGKGTGKKTMKKRGERRRHSMLSLKMKCYRNPRCHIVPDICTKMLEVHEFEKGRQEV